MKNLYEFIHTYTKKQKIRLDDLAQHCGFSRSTMYRYMRGQLDMPPDVEQRIADILQLNAKDRTELHRLIDLSGDDSISQARAALDTFFFHHVAAQTAPSQTQTQTDALLTCYQRGDRYLRTLEELTAALLQYATKENFSCHVWVYNCTTDDIWPQLFPALDALLRSSDNAAVTHLFQIDEKHVGQNISKFLHILPMLYHTQYRSCTATADSSGLQTLFHHFVLFSCSFSVLGKTKQRSFAVSFQEGGLSPCLSFQDRDTLHFFEHALRSMMHEHSNHVVAQHGTILSDELLALQQQHDTLIFKSSLCYNDVPVDIYQSMVKRMLSNPAGTAQLHDTLHTIGPYDQSNTMQFVQRILQGLAVRHACSYNHQHIGVHSKEGLLQMAHSGRLSDHIASLPSFSPEERKRIFSYICNRNADPNDDFTIYVTQKPLLYADCFVSVIKDYGFLVQFYGDKTDKHPWEAFAIADDKLAEVTYDYAEKHVANIHALPVAEATEFLNSLIAMQDQLTS